MESAAHQQPCAVFICSGTDAGGFYKALVQPARTQVIVSNTAGPPGVEDFSVAGVNAHVADPTPAFQFKEEQVPFL